jgi:hypothetical protein
MEKSLHIAVISVILVALLFVPTSVPAQTSLTHATGPYRPHEVRDVALSNPGGTQRIYAADAETLKYSTDGGANWYVTTGPMLAPKVVAVSQADVNRVHVGQDGYLQ